VVGFDYYSFNTEKIDLLSLLFYILQYIFQNLRLEEKQMQIRLPSRKDLVSIVSAGLIGIGAACGPKPVVESTPQERGLVFLDDFDSYQRRGRPREVKPFHVPRGFGILKQYELVRENGMVVGSTEILFMPQGTDSLLMYFDGNRSGDIPDYIGDYVLHSSSRTASGGIIYHWNGVNDLNTWTHRLCNAFNCDLDYDEAKVLDRTLKQDSEYFKYLLAEAKTQ